MSLTFFISHKRRYFPSCLFLWLRSLIGLYDCQTGFLNLMWPTFHFHEVQKSVRRSVPLHFLFHLPPDDGKGITVDEIKWLEAAIPVDEEVILCFLSWAKLAEERKATNFNHWLACIVKKLEVFSATSNDATVVRHGTCPENNHCWQYRDDWSMTKWFVST